MTSILECSRRHREDHCDCHLASTHDAGRRSQWDESHARTTGFSSWDWRKISLYKQLLLGIFFIAGFFASDGSSTASQSWEGAPPWYLPVGLTLALLLYSGNRYLPIVFIASVVAAATNYHRPLFSWCGIPGAVAVYIGYAWGASILRGRWRIDLRLGTLRDVGRYIVVSLGGSILSTVAGILTLLGDGRIRRSEVISTLRDWWVSDALAIVAFAPFLLVFVAPLVGRGVTSGNGTHRSESRPSRPAATEILQLTAQFGLVVFAIWFVFGYVPAIPYQPLYLLFVPVIWGAVRRGVRGAVLTTFAISVGMMFAAWVTQAQKGSLPKLQFAMLALGVTGLCLGAVVTSGANPRSAIASCLNATWRVSFAPRSQGAS